MSASPCYFACRAEHSAELFIVEGKHAANAVNRARDKSNQAVLAMQGKVPNVVKNNLRQQIARNEHVRQLISVLTSKVDSDAVPVRTFNRVLILSDPDADGLHAAMLLVCLLAEAFPDLVREERLLLCRCPLFMLASDEGEYFLAYSAQEMRRRQDQEGHSSTRVQRFKGVASLPLAVLHSACVDPVSRSARLLSEPDCALIKQRLL